MTLEPTLEMAEQEELFTIGDLARELGTTTRTIRYYILGTVINCGFLCV